MGQTGASYDFLYLLKPTWTVEDEAVASRIKRELGFFSDPRMQSAYEQEYPPTD